MKAFRSTAVLYLCVCGVVLAQQTNDLPTSVIIDGVSYSEVRWGSLTPAMVTIFHKAGVARIPVEKLPVEVQEHYGYGPKKAAELPSPPPAQPPVNLQFQPSVYSTQKMSAEEAKRAIQFLNEHGRPGTGNVGRVDHPAVPAGSSREIEARRSRVMAAGVGRIGIAAFNVAGSPFGEYDKALIRAVQSRWYALISQNGLYNRSGTVTLRFDLMQDGAVKDMEIKENSAGEILGLFCQKAIVDSAPFAPLPESLRKLIGNDPREVNFTFYY